MTKARRAPGAGGAGLDRAVITDAEYGACVLLPKTAWKQWPASGRAQARVNGRLLDCVVRIRRCNCRGEGWHEHRFLVLPAKAGIKGRISLLPA